MDVSPASIERKGNHGRNEGHCCCSCSALAPLPFVQVFQTFEFFHRARNETNDSLIILLVSTPSLKQIITIFNKKKKKKKGMIVIDRTVSRV